MAISFTFVISSIFLAYIFHSVYTMFSLVSPPSCEPNMKCFDYFTKSQSELQAVGYVSDKMRASSTDVRRVVRMESFDPNQPWEKEVKVALPESTKRNGSLYFHLFLLRPSVKTPTFATAKIDRFHVYSVYPLTAYQTPSLNFELLKGEMPKKELIVKPITHIRKEVTFNILMDVNRWPDIRNIPPEILPFIMLNDKLEVLPIMEFDSLSDRFDKLVPLPEEATSFTLKYSPINIGKFRLRLHAVVACKTFKEYGFADKDIDQLKSIFSTTNMFVLGITVLVSSFHILFDFLAIKSDVKFWKSKKSMVGISLRTLCWRAFSQVIVLLYLFDEETSLIIVIPTAIGTAIEFWKVHKVMPIDWRTFKFKNIKRSDGEKLTEDIDQTGMKYLSHILYPLCICGAAYSLMYLQHKSWYSWIIHSLVNGVYGFGFLFMLPQLWINYKMKSVAHLPWKTFMYKAFNTFIDDVFAFIIEMPAAHRIACFRDDVVFIIYLYQRWLYPVDQNRVDADEHVD